MYRSRCLSGMPWVLFILLSVLFISGCNIGISSSKYRVVSYNAAFVIDSVTIGVTRRSYIEERPEGDVGSFSFSDPEYWYCTYDLETGELTEEELITTDVSHGSDDPYFFTYPYLLVSIPYELGSSNTFLHNIESGETEILPGRNKGAYWVSDSGKYACVTDVVNTETMEEVEFDEGFDPFYIDEEEGKAYHYGYDFILSYDMETENVDTLVKGIDPMSTYRILVLSNNNYFGFKSGYQLYRYIKKDIFFNNPDTIQEINRLDSLDYEYRYHSINFEYGIFVATSGGNIYIRTMDTDGRFSEPQMILDGTSTKLGD